MEQASSVTPNVADGVSRYFVRWGAPKRAWLGALAVGLAFFLAAKLGVATGLPPDNVVVLWPSNAILLAALLSVPPRNWWIYFLVTLAAEIAADVPTYRVAAALGYGVANFFEAALATSLMLRFGGSSRGLATVRDFVVFVMSGPLVASAAAALIGAGLHKFASPETGYWEFWRVYWFSDATGLLIVGAVILVWREKDGWSALTRRPKLFEALVLMAGLSATAFYVFGYVAPSATFSPRVYLLFPFLLWSAFRFGRHGASVTIGIVTTIAIGTAVMGLGPFVGFSNLSSVLTLQGVLAIVTLSILTIAFALEELQRSYRALERANLDLDRQVALRTRELREALTHNEVLLKEIHHRVKNNLQLVGSVLDLYARSVSDPVARQKFSEVQAQIVGIAEVHEQLYKTESFEAVDFGKLVAGLCGQIARGAGPHVEISTDTSGEGWISTDMAMLLSVVVNELVTNSIKYGTAGGAVAIRVRARADGGRLVLTIADSGPGFPADLDIDQLTGFGMRMTRQILGRAGGTITSVPSPQGAVLEISVPLAPAPAADAAAG